MQKMAADRNRWLLDETDITDVLPMVVDVYPMVTEVYPMVAEESSVANPQKLQKLMKKSSTDYRVPPLASVWYPTHC
jgi:hypothetical protein